MRPDAVLIQFELLRMSIIVLETCRGDKEFVHQVGKTTIIILGCTVNKILHCKYTYSHAK